MYDLTTIENWLLSKGSMTPKKLQKMLYYCYSWYLTLENESTEDLNNRLFDANFEAWVHGPVIPEVYHRYKNNGSNEIASVDTKPELDEDTEDTLNQVWEIYGNYNGNQLESITHQEEPWRMARGDCKPLDRCNTVIDDNTMFNYYIQRLTDE